jgi:hypothetical protein
VSRGEVLYTAGWVVGYVIACVFYLYITKDNEYTMAKYIDDFKLLGALYMLAYFFFVVFCSVFFADWFEPNKLGWAKRVYLSVVVTGVGIAIWMSLLGVSGFPFNIFGEDFLSILFSAWVFIVIPVIFGVGIMILLAEALGVEYS